MVRLRKQFSRGHFFSISGVAVFVVGYTSFGLWLFGTKPAVPDHAVIGCAPRVEIS